MTTHWRSVHLTLVLTFFCCFCLKSAEAVDIPTIAKFFSTKIRYEEVNPHLIKNKHDVNQFIIQPPSSTDQCREIHLTAIIRHGTRNPTRKPIEKMQHLYNVVKETASVRNGLLHEVQQWKMWYTEDMDGELVEKGKNDHENLAARLLKMFPNVMSKEKLKGGLIKFITSSKHRCVDSIKSFEAELMKQWGITDMEFKHEVRNDLMRFWEHCAKYMQEVKNNPTALVEVEVFKNGQEMKGVRKKIANSLQIQENIFTSDMAEAAFFLCAFELAIKTESSPWCKLFDEADAKVLEYASDLKLYWTRSYGYDINSKSSCNLFHDVFSRLEKSVREHRSGKVVTEAAMIQVGHAETLLPLLTLLGFFKDNQPLTSKNYANSRTFRSSGFLPFAANLVLVLFDCGTDGLRLQTLLNEKVVTFPDLTEMAPYEDVRKHYKKLLEDCDFVKECQVKQAAHSKQRK